MTRPNTPATLDRLHRAIALVETELDNDEPFVALGALRDLGARHHTGPVTNRLSYCGVSATCTWSAEGGLLQAWLRVARRKATRLAAERQGGGRHG